jgi:hypothetical protein
MPVSLTPSFRFSIAEFWPRWQLLITRIGCFFSFQPLLQLDDMQLVSSLRFTISLTQNFFHCQISAKLGRMIAP